jgi:hypothetical protein
VEERGPASAGPLLFLGLRQDERFFAVAFPPLRPAAFFCAVVPPRDDVDRERDVVEAERDLDVPDVDRALLVPEVERERDVVERDEPELDFARDFAAVARPPLAPAAFFCAVVPPRLDVARALLVPEVERERELVERALDVERLAAVARPPLAPAAFF